MAFEYELTAREAARAELVTDKLIADAAAEGLRVERESLLGLPSVRLAIISESAGLPDNYMDEIRRLVPDQVRVNEVKRQLNDADSDLHKGLERLSPFQRAAIGHDMEKQKKAEEASAPALTASEEASRILLLRQIAHLPTRISMARKWGIA